MKENNSDFVIRGEGFVEQRFALLTAWQHLVLDWK